MNTMTELTAMKSDMFDTFDTIRDLQLAAESAQGRVSGGLMKLGKYLKSRAQWKY